MTATDPKPWELPRAQRNRVPARELRPGDQFVFNAAAGTVIAVRQLTEEELDQDINLRQDPENPWLIIAYSDMTDPATTGFMRKPSDAIFRGVLRAEQDAAPEDAEDPTSTTLAETALRLADELDKATSENTISLDGWSIELEMGRWDGASEDDWAETIERRRPARFAAMTPQITSWLRAIPNLIREMPRLRAEHAALTPGEQEQMRLRLHGAEDVTLDEDPHYYFRQHLLVDADVTVFRALADSEDVRRGADPTGVGYYFLEAWLLYVDLALGTDATRPSLSAHLHAAMRLLEGVGIERQLRVRTARIARLEEELKAERTALGDIVRAGFAAKLPPNLMMESTGLSRQRIYQIRDGVR